MEDKKYQVGDKVYIRQGLIVGKPYGERNITFLEGMRKDVGRPMMIFKEGMSGAVYRVVTIDEPKSVWWLSPEMISNYNMRLDYTPNEVLAFLED